MKKYYVYALIDPRTDKPFYIGKGCERRIFHHEMAVRGKRERNLAKANIINSIWADGFMVRKRFLGWTDNEARAFRWERRLISRQPSLTNIVSGTTRVHSLFRMVFDAIAGRGVDRHQFQRIWNYGCLQLEGHRQLYEIGLAAIDKFSKLKNA